jgi:transcriptional regulator with XRE-family HTH domain
MTIAQLITDARKSTSLTQEALAESLNKSTQWIGAMETGKAMPSLDLLLRVHGRLTEESATVGPDLKLWLLAWLESKLEIEQGKERDLALDTIKELYRDSGRPGARKVRPWTAPCTLRDFPEAFEDLVIVCGDRRESPPKTKGDLFVDSFSSADLVSLKALFERTGPLDLRSDKAFALGHEYVRREYAHKNIIVLGSPAVNILARDINKHAVFRFSIPKSAREFLRCLDEEIPEINDPDLRVIFWDMASKWKEGPSSPIPDTMQYYEDFKSKGFRVHKDQVLDLKRKVSDLLGDHTAKEMRSLFRKPGFIDPVDARLQGFYTRQDNDFGVISLCPNPYSDGKHFCILAAGIHAPGTDMAVRVLASNDFKDHPLGGVIEVKLNLDAAWMERLSNATFDWQTRPYSVESLVDNLRQPKTHSVFERCEEKDIENLVAFVERFADGSSGSRCRPEPACHLTADVPSDRSMTRLQNWHES